MAIDGVPGAIGVKKKAFKKLSKETAYSFPTIFIASRINHRAHFLLLPLRHSPQPLFRSGCQGAIFPSLFVFVHIYETYIRKPHSPFELLTLSGPPMLTFATEKMARAEFTPTWIFHQIRGLLHIIQDEIEVVVSHFM